MLHFIEHDKVHPSTFYALAMVGNLKNVNSTFAQMSNKNINVEFTTFSHTIANTMLGVHSPSHVIAGFLVIGH